MAEKDTIAEAREAFDDACEVERDNRREALEDLRFVRLSEQWDTAVLRQREKEGRPCLTINKLTSFVRQVVNDARQNKPSIKVHPVDDKADVATADVMNGLIRNIEYSSNADVAYDTATEDAVSMGWGYFKIDLDYAHDDAFDIDIQINRVSDPFSIYGDPNSTAADSSDWRTAFETTWLTHKAFEAEYGREKEKIDWDTYAEGARQREQWVNEDKVLVARWWQREEVMRKLLKLSDGQIVLADGFDLELQRVFDPTIEVAGEREGRYNAVTRRVLTGQEQIAEDKWPGCFIPIVPIYGDEVDVEGKRYFRSLIRDAKDAQRMFNYWRTASTELVALAPKAPWIGPKGAFKTDKAKWAVANTQTLQYIEYDGPQAPSRTPFDGPPAAALQEALNAADDMKAVIGMYDASLGARSNETSGRAIMARQKEGDVATFHFQDNMTRAIRHAGRILLDLIPKVYSAERIIRVIGEDGSAKIVPLKTETPETDAAGEPVQDPETGQPKVRIYDLSKGKYDLVVKAGPNFSTRREEAALQMTEYVRSVPQAGPLIGGLIAKNLDWPGADEIAKRLDAMLPPQAAGGMPPEIDQAMQEMQGNLQKLETENQSLKGDKSLEAAKLQIDKFNAQTQRMKAEADAAVALADRKASALKARADNAVARMEPPKGAPDREGDAMDDGGARAVQNGVRDQAAGLNDRVVAELIANIEDIVTGTKRARVHRGPDGRIAGLVNDNGELVQQVVRDENGQVVGLQ